MIFIKEMLDKAIECAIEGTTKWATDRVAIGATIESIEIDWEIRHMNIKVLFVDSKDPREGVGVSVYSSENDCYTLQLRTNESYKEIKLSKEDSITFAECFFIKNLTSGHVFIIQEYIKLRNLNDNVFTFIFKHKLEGVKLAVEKFERTLKTYEGLKELVIKTKTKLDDKADSATLPF